MTHFNKGEMHDAAIYLHAAIIEGSQEEYSHSEKEHEFKPSAQTFLKCSLAYLQTNKPGKARQVLNMGLKTLSEKEAQKLQKQRDMLKNIPKRP